MFLRCSVLLDARQIAMLCGEISVSQTNNIFDKIYNVNVAKHAY